MKEVLLTSAAMKAADVFNIEQLGRTSLGLQEAAALAVCREIPPSTKGVLVLAGGGNNGADGLAAARLACTSGCHAYAVECMAEKGNFTKEYEIQRARAKEAGVSFLSAEEFLAGKEQYEGYCILDALFGVGLSRPVSEELCEILRAADTIPDAYKLAVDLPSGISADTGEVLGYAMSCHVTVTFGWNKIGLVAEPGAEYAGRVVVADIGFAKDTLKRAQISPNAYAFTGKADLLKRSRRSNKGTYGRLLVIAGTKNMAGASFFAATAAYRTGCGLVKILTPEENRLILQVKIPEAVLSVYRDDDDEEILKNQVRQCMDWADCILLGPGIGKEKTAQFLTKTVLAEHTVPLLLDADGLNILSDHPNWMESLSASDVLTPHYGELSRLMGVPIGELMQKPVAYGQKLAGLTGAVCLIKDANTMICSPNGNLAVNAYSGNNGMATGGSGDVLSGVIAGLMTCGMQADAAAALGAYLHGLAGDAACAKVGPYALMASDILDGLCTVTREQEKQDRVKTQSHLDEQEYI